MEKLKMANSQIRFWATGLLIATVMVFTGCNKEAPKPKAADNAAVEKTTPSPGEPAKVDKGVAEAPKAGAEAPKVAHKPTPSDVKAPTDKATLAKAYVEIYCAQRKKETERLLEIYTRYGFADPKSWTASWTEAAKDDAWVAEITQKAIQTCP